MLSTYAHNIQNNYSLPQVQFSSLNLGSLSISIINQIPTKLLFISQLCLDNNLLITLAGIQQFMNLEAFSVNFNFIEEKNQFLHIKNKFLIRQLSFIGNPCENKITQKQLKFQGFNNLMKLNYVQRINKVAINKNISFNKQFINQYDDQIIYCSKQYNNNRVKFIFQFDNKRQNKQIQNQTQRIYNQSAKNSRFIQVTKREPNTQFAKQKQRFESTGDTRRKKLSSKRLNQSSKYNNSFDSSPNFNRFYESSLNLPSKQYLSSTKRRKITQFKLHPVDQYNYIKRNYQNQQIEDQNDQQDEYKKLTKNYENRGDFRYFNNKYDKYPRRITPFEIIDERNQAYYQQRPYEHYRSDNYQLRSNDRKRRIQSLSSDNNVIERQIPVYKQAIAIAFYYQNLLRKVFRGFVQIIQDTQADRCDQNKKQQNESKQIFQQKYSPQESQQQQDETQYRIKNISFGKQTYNNNKNKQQILNYNNIDTIKQIDLKKYAWMKLQLFVNYNKIIDKYSNSNINKQLLLNS